MDLRNVKSARKMLIGLGWLLPVPCSQIAMNRWGLEVMVNLQWSKTAARTETPPLPAQDRSKNPPLLNRELSSRGSTNQKLPRAPGVQGQISEGNAPRLQHVTLDDLRDPGRLAKLYEQATRAGLLAETVATRLQWFAAAEHALAVGKRNPCGLFTSVWRRRLWHHITQADEDIARATLKMLDFGEGAWLARRVPGGDSPDATLAA